MAGGTFPGPGGCASGVDVAGCTFPGSGRCASGVDVEDCVIPEAGWRCAGGAVVVCNISSSNVSTAFKDNIQNVVTYFVLFIVLTNFNRALKIQTADVQRVSRFHVRHTNEIL